MMSARKPPAHKRTPKDLQQAVSNSQSASKTWDQVTPLAKSEWICWVTSGKLAETRVKRIDVAVNKLSKGDRRPCCWAGCPHRK